MQPWGITVSSNDITSVETSWIRYPKLNWGPSGGLQRSVLRPIFPSPLRAPTLFYIGAPRSSLAHCSALHPILQLTLRAPARPSAPCSNEFYSHCDDPRASVKTYLWNSTKKNVWLCEAISLTPSLSLLSSRSTAIYVSSFRWERWRKVISYSIEVGGGSREESWKPKCQWSRVAYVPCLCFFSTSLLLFVSVTPQREPYECLINLIVAVLNRHRCAIVEVLETRPTKRVFSFERKKKLKANSEIRSRKLLHGVSGDTCSLQ